MNAKLVALMFLALLAAQPASAATYPITIQYGRSWPLSVVVDSARGVAYVDGTSGEYPPTGFTFGVVNVTSHQLTKVLPLEEIPGPMAIDEANGDVYIAGNQSIAVFYAGNQSFGRELDVRRPILDIAFDGNVSGDIFFTSGNAVFALDPEDGAVVANATVANGAGGMALDQSNGRLYVAEYPSGPIAVFQASTLAPAGTIALPGCCVSQLALDSMSQVIYASTGTNYVDMINAATAAFVKSVQVAPSSQNSTNSIVVDSKTGRVYVTSTPGESILELDGTNGAVTRTLSASSVVAGLALDMKTNELYATNYHQITVFDVSRSGTFLLLLVGGGAVAAIAAIAVYAFVKRRNSRERMKIHQGWHDGGSAPSGP